MPRLLVGLRPGFSRGTRSLAQQFASASPIAALSFVEGFFIDPDVAVPRLAGVVSGFENPVGRASLGLEMHQPLGFEDDELEVHRGSVRSIRA
jgi:hypothetical protein